MRDWNRDRSGRDARIAAGAAVARGKAVHRDDAVRLLEALLKPGDRVCLEGDNQKQADLLAARSDARSTRDASTTSTWCSPAWCCPNTSTCSRRASPSGSTIPIRARRRRAWPGMLFGGKIELGAVHTYLELFARYFVDLTPQVALIAAVSADRDGNLYTGPNTEDTPTVVEATTFKNGVVVAQVNEIVDRVPRVDIPGDRVHFVVEAGRPSTSSRCSPATPAP